MADPTALLEAGTRQGDPAADAVVESFAARAGGEGWATLESVLAAVADDGSSPGAGDRHGARQAGPGLGRGAALDRLRAATVDEPELRALVEPMLAPPAWYDADLADAGAVAFWRVGSSTLFLTLTYGSLAFGYQSARLSRPLAATGRLEAMAPRRLAETTRWALSVTTPGSMRPGGAGWASSLRVRLVHALIRRKLRRTSWWDHAGWGVPISASDGFATAIGGFCVIPMRAMQDLGVRFSPAEEEAVAHLWRWIAYVMGVPEPLLPSGIAASREWVDAALAMDDGPTADGPRLMRALLDHGLPSAKLLPGPAGAVAQAAGSRVAAGFARRWLGADMADKLDVPKLTPAPLVPLLRPLQRARDVVRASGVVGDGTLTRAEIAVVQRLLALQRAPRAPLGPEAEAVAELARPAAAA